MKITATWHKTNDQILFDSVNDELCQWFVQVCQSKNTKFFIADMITDVPLKARPSLQLIEEISEAIDVVNAFMKKLRLQEFAKPTDWFDQYQLNRLHKDWARSRTEIPNLPVLMYKTDKALFDAYNQTNCHIHLIENSFHYDFRDNDNHWRMDNPFKDVFVDWQICNLSIPYPGHGREAFEKFRNFDQEVNVDDLCNWDNIDSYVQINLVRPYQTTPPAEFLTWCQEKQLVPHTHTMPLANLSDWQNNLTQSRGVVTKNINIEDNYFTLT